MTITRRDVNVKEELDALTDPDGHLRPRRVVDAAKPESHPLHPHFEWRDDIAADHYRLGQARTLIASVRIETQVHRRTYEVPAYVRSPSLPPAQQGYRAINAVRRRSDEARDVMLDELARVASALERARSVAAILGLEEDLKDLLTSALHLRARVQENETT